MVIKVSKLKRSPSFREQAYRNIKEIVLHQLAAGQPLIVEELVTQFGISRTPVREALLALEQEGLIECLPSKGTFVIDPSPEEVEQVFQVREVLEPLAVKLAVPRVPDHELERVRVLFDSVRDAIENGDFDPYFESDTRFHELIAPNAGNQVLKEIIDNLNERVYRIRVRARRRSTSHLIRSFEEHCLVLDALTKRDASRAERLMREHIRNAGKRIVSIMS